VFLANAKVECEEAAQFSEAAEPEESTKACCDASNKEGKREL
jgi:hypothetical protein